MSKRERDRIVFWTSQDDFEPLEQGNKFALKLDLYAMEAHQDFRLTWVNYSQKLTEAFNKFLTRESLCNVTLSVHRKTIKAHQAILSACSPWFEEILLENQHPHPIIILKDVRYEDLRNIIKFIYTGEVSVPQHELQDFLRTAELLEIKGLLKSFSDNEPTTPSFSTLVTTTPNPMGALQNHGGTSHIVQANHLPTLPTVPVSSLVLNNHNSINNEVPINELVSQIKVPVSLPLHPASPSSPNPQYHDGHTQGKKRRLNEHKMGSGIKKRTMNQAATHTLMHPTTHVIVSSDQASLVQTTDNGASLLTATTIDGDGVNWMEESSPRHSDEVQNHSDHSHETLTPAQVVANGVNDCGAFKRIWAERYLCYNLGREIICLLCFCRFTQFKKFNLERHMRNKHAQLYNLTEATRKQILERYVARYEEHVTPGMVASVPAHGNEHMASEIMAVGPIQLDDLDLDLDLETSVMPQLHIPGTHDDEEDGNKTKLDSTKLEPPEGGVDDHDRKATPTPPSADMVVSDPLQNPPEQLIVECELEEPVVGNEMVLVKQEKGFSL